MITNTQLRAIMPLAGARADKFVAPLVAAMAEFEINTIYREAAFLAQVAHESGQLVYVRELASGAAYEGRADLGNTQPGDGVQYKGRGLVQITGRANYAACGDALNLDLLEQPVLLEDPINACRSAAWFWRKHGLNALADAGNFRQITRVINGGYNGEDARLAFYNRALSVLGES